MRRVPHRDRLDEGPGRELAVAHRAHAHALDAGAQRMRDTAAKIHSVAGGSSLNCTTWRHTSAGGASMSTMVETACRGAPAARPASTASPPGAASSTTAAIAPGSLAGRCDSSPRRTR